MKTKDKLLILFHTIILSLLLFFFFGKLWLFFINLLPIGLFFIRREEDV